MRSTPGSLLIFFSLERLFPAGQLFASLLANEIMPAPETKTPEKGANRPRRTEIGLQVPFSNSDALVHRVGGVRRRPRPSALPILLLMVYRHLMALVVHLLPARHGLIRGGHVVGIIHACCIWLPLVHGSLFRGYLTPGRSLHLEAVAGRLRSEAVRLAVRRRRRGSSSASRTSRNH